MRNPRMPARLRRIPRHRSGALMAVEPLLRVRQSPRPTGATGSPPTWRWPASTASCAGARSWWWSARPARARARCCALNGLETIDSGTITVDGVSLTDPPPTSIAGAPTWAWCSSTSTCSSIATRSTTWRCRSAWCAAATAPRPSATPASCWAASAWPSTAPAIPASCPAASSSAWRSRARWPWIPSSCYSTRPRRRSIPRPWAASWS